MLFEELNGVASDCRSYLVADGPEALIVEPLYERVEAYLARLGALGLRLAVAADTHTHADHVSGVKELARRTGAVSAGAPRGVVQLPLSEGDVVTIRGVRIEVWNAPGHTSDSLAFVLPGRVIAADTLTIASTGRTDLPTGDPEAAWESAQRLLTLPDATELWPGHDYNQRTFSTIGEERRTNPRMLLGREKFLAAMREPRPSKPARMAEALEYNLRPPDLSGEPPLAPVPATKTYAGATIEEALDRFEEDCSQEFYQGLTVLERREHLGGISVRYEVRWKHSVFDDNPDGLHQAHALVRHQPPAGPAAQFRVIAASPARHNL